MGFSFDSYGNLKQPKMFLYNSKTNPLGTIIGAENIKLEQNFHKLFELNFKIYKNVNNEETEFYDKIIKNKLIEVQYINLFQILSAIEKYDDTAKETYKEVKCCPLENSLIYRKVYDINGVFGLWDITDTEHSLLHLISAECGWNIGHVSNSLLTKFRTFNIDSMEIYNLMTTKLQDSFGCIFQFDNYTKTINAYLLSELNELTDIVISKKNVLKEYIKDDSESAIITKMRVKGGDDGNGNQVNIRAVNFGRNYLINLDYYMTTEWVSQSLVDAYATYKTACDNARTSFNQSLATLKTKNAELTTLKTALADLKSLKLAQEDVIGASVSNHGRVPIPTDTDYSIYQNAVTLVNTYLSQITAKESEITAKENEIATVHSTLDSISNNIDESNYFTSEQIAEMNNFITEGEDFEDSSYVITSETSEEEALEIKTELMQSADEDLAIKSKPNYTFNIKASSLYTIQDDKDELIPYSYWKTQLKVGSLITLFIGSTWMTVRLMSIIINFDNPEEIELKFSTKSRLDDELTQLAEIIADSGRASSTLSLKQLGYDEASKLVNPVREFINGTLSATLNAFQSNDNQEMLYDKFGLHGKKWLPDQNKYSDNQLWINNNGLLLTSDGWKTSSLALGLLTAPDGSTYYGLNADVIAGNLILGNKLNISNTSGTYSINDNGFTATNGIYSVGINPTTPSEIINVKVNGVNQFYIDTTSQSLAYKGKITGGSIDINGNFLVSNSGILTAVDGNFSGKITALSGNIGGFTLDTTQLTAGTTNKFMRISPYSTTPGTNNYTSTYGAIDLGRTTDGLDTIIHLRSDGYARFGLASMLGAVKFNYIDTGGTAYSFYTPNFRIESDNGFVTARYIRSISGEELWLTSTDADLTVGSDNGTAMLYGNTVQIYGYNGTPLTYNGDNVITSATNYHGTLYAGSSPSNISAYFSTSGNFVSTSANTLGTSSNQWVGAYLGSSTMTTSDRNKKNTINPLSEQYYELFKRLIPVSFKYNNGTSDRFHVGFIAQDVEIAMQEVGLSSLDFAGLIKSPIYAEYDEQNEPIITSEIINYVYFLRYEEFISINTYVIQKQESKLQELENRILQLELA